MGSDTSDARTVAGCCGLSPAMILDLWALFGVKSKITTDDLGP